MRELKVMTLGRQLSLVHSSKNSSASFQSPAFSQALIRLLYVITLRSHPCAQQPRSAPRTSHRVPCPADRRTEHGTTVSLTHDEVAFGPQRKSHNLQLRRPGEAGQAQIQPPRASLSCLWEVALAQAGTGGGDLRGGPGHTSSTMLR